MVGVASRSLLARRVINQRPGSCQPDGRGPQGAAGADQDVPACAGTVVFKTTAICPLGHPSASVFLGNLCLLATEPTGPVSPDVLPSTPPQSQPLRAPACRAHSVASISEPRRSVVASLAFLLRFRLPQHEKCFIEALHFLTDALVQVPFLYRIQPAALHDLVGNRGCLPEDSHPP